MTIWFLETVIILALASELSTFASTLPCKFLRDHGCYFVKKIRSLKGLVPPIS